MEESEDIFTVTYLGRTYKVKAAPGASLETVWLSQKSWFSSGTEVTISDSEGNSRSFHNDGTH